MYRDYNELFKKDLGESLKNRTTYDYSCFQNIFIALLNKDVPIKKKIMCFNNNLFMSKALRKPIMHRPKLKSVYNKCKTENNFCVNLLRKTKTKCF